MPVPKVSVLERVDSIKRKKVSLPVHVRRSNTPLLKLPIVSLAGHTWICALTFTTARKEVLISTTET